MTENRRQIMPEVYLTHCPSDKFKTGLLSAQLITPLRADSASACALLPEVLQRGTVRCPDMERIGAALDEMYGAGLSTTARKRGESLCFGFVMNFLDDALLPERESLLEKCADFLGELWLDPVTRGGRFLSEYVESEKENLIDAIQSLRNDKREWADARLVQLMCADEPYGVDRWGDEPSVRRLNHRTLYGAYQRLLSQSRLELFYCGSASRRRVEEALLHAFAQLPRGAVEPPAPVVRRSAPEQVRTVTETMDVEQGRLAVGYRCASGDVPALTMANLLFGGTGNSRLFMNVREKLSLCYYISTLFVRSKSILTLSAGIDCTDRERVLEEIAAQRESLCRGELELWELPAATASAVSALTSLGDSQGALENYYLGQAATGLSETPEEFARALAEVTPERIAAAAQTVVPDTVYFLGRKEPC